VTLLCNYIRDNLFICLGLCIGCFSSYDAHHTEDLKNVLTDDEPFLVPQLKSQIVSKFLLKQCKYGPCQILHKKELVDFKLVS
jgi:hypothetical protein